jgi:uncharacterized protein (TIGR00369 family)
MLDHLTDAENGKIDWREFAGHYFGDAHPMFSQFNVKIIDVSDQEVKMEASLSRDLRAEHSEQFLHTGALSLLLDSAFGIALFAHIRELTPIATINLKTDYLSPAKSEAKLICTASCFARDGNVARMQGEVCSYASRTVLAKATAAFMIGTKGPSFASPKGT